jgi:OmpR-family two-component system manganese-sensing response regulator
MVRINNQKRILLIDDDISLLKILSLQLTYSGFIVDIAETGKRGLNMVLRGEYDTIVLDIGLPDKSGMSVCRDIRANGITTPILILSGETSKKTVVGGLQTGADDYLEKPFYKTELLARINALIRRNQQSFSSSLHSYRGLVLDSKNYTLQTVQRPLKLTEMEALVMQNLMRFAPKTVTREELFQRVWGISNEHASNRLDVYVRRLRHKLLKLETGITIHTVYGKGYRLR